MTDVYKDKAWLYEHYVQKRMNLTDICKVLKQSYNIEVTQTGVQIDPDTSEIKELPTFEPA